MVCAPEQIIHRWDIETRVKALKILLEMDKVNFWLPEDFAATVKFPQTSMIAWCQNFLTHFEEKYSGSAELLQVVCDIFRTSKETLALKIIFWYILAQTHLDDETLAVLSTEKVEKWKILRC